MLNNKLHKKYNDNETLVCKKKKCRFNAFIKSVSVHNIALKIQKNESGFPLTRGRNGFLNFFFLFGEDSSKPVSNRSTGLLHVSSDLGKQGRQSLCGKDPEFGSSVSGTARCNLSDFKQNPAKTKLPFLYSFLHVHPLVFLYPFILIIMSCTVVFELSNKKNQVNLD